MYEEKYLIQIIKYLLNSDDSKCEIPLPTQELDWEEMLRIAGRHSIGSLLYHILIVLAKELQPRMELKEHMLEVAMNAASADIHQRMQIEELIRQFEDHELYCMPVKGADTKNYYPKSEWRTMGDLDILYKPEQHKEVKALLLQMGYENFESGLKHDHYSKGPYIALEMHRELVAANTIAESYYSDIWQKTKPREDYEYVYQMSVEEQYIYTMIHLLEHFKDGGIGIRFVMDIYVFHKQEDVNWQYVEGVFEEIGILSFARNIERLAQRWFACEYVAGSSDVEELLDELEVFIIQNGIYGQRSHLQNMAMEREGSVGYIKRMVFPNYNSMKTLYPWLSGKPYLLPFAWFIRIVRTVLFRKSKIQMGIDTLKHGDAKQGKELLEFYKRCGV